jgi:chromate transporter
VRLGGLPWMQGAFYGIGAAVIAIIARSALKLTRLTLGADRVSWSLFALAAAVTAWTESEIVWVFLGAGVFTVLWRGHRLSRAPKVPAALAVMVPTWSAGLLGPPATAATLWRIAWYFAEAGAFVFGSGLAIVPFLHAGVVQDLRWLDERQFMDAVAVAMITPGPVVITVGFIGFLVAGVPGAVLAALATFLPCYVFTVVPAPHFRRLSRIGALRAFVDGVTAAATGAIAGAVVVLGRRALVDVSTVAIALASLAALASFKRLREPVLVLAAGVTGVALTALALDGRGGGASASRPTVVFVCEHGSAKSLVAARFFERMARERGVSAVALSRGTAPDPTVPTAVVEALRADGFEVADFRPQALAEADVAGAARVVTIGVPLGRLAGAAGSRVEAWDDIPPVSTSYPAARAALIAHVEVLLEKLKGAPRGR